jgi:hypothetical protein
LFSTPEVLWELRTLEAIMRGKVLLILCSLVAIAFAPPARAEDPNTDGWEFKAAPYIWALSLDGDMTVKGNTAAVDVNIIEESKSGPDIAFFKFDFFSQKENRERLNNDPTATGLDPIFLAQERASALSDRTWQRSRGGSL